MFRKILVGYDGSQGAVAALHRGAVMAKEFNAQISALWVCEPLPRHSDLPGEFEGESEAADNYYQARREEVKIVAAEIGIEISCETRRGHAAKMVVKFANEGKYDLIVIGHSDHSELWGRLLGDTADRITDHANCSVLVVKGYQNAPAKCIQ